MKKVITNAMGGASHNVNYQPEGKPVYTAPIISSSYVNEDNEVIHILENGNELSEANFIKHWGQPKGIINWKAKGNNPDSRKHFLK